MHARGIYGVCGTRRNGRVNVDPAGPVFCPRLTRTLASCSPRSHPSSHALFHPGETIVHAGRASQARPVPSPPCPRPPSPPPPPADEETVMSRVRRKGKRNAFFLSTRWNAMARWIRGVPSRRAKPSVSQPRAARCWTKVGPRGAKGRPPRSLYGGAAPRPRSKTCRNGRKGCPPLAPPSANRHEDTTRRVLYISRVSEVSVTSTA